MMRREAPPAASPEPVERTQAGIEPTPAPPEPSTRSSREVARTPARPARTRLSVVSEPAAATVTVGGEAKGVAPLTLDLASDEDQVLTLSLEGFETKEVRLEARRIPPSLKVALDPLPPPGAVAFAASYPLDVIWKGRTLAKGGTAGRVPLPPGRQTLTLVSSQNFLRREVSVDVSSGQTTALDAPGLGRINIKANPDNCEVLIGGTFVDYPPILDRAIVAGTHTVTFRWPDGVKRDETVEVRQGGVAYVMGRRN